MKLIEFSVTNYRSITSAHKIELNNLTILVGKNNEGKSNILNALSVSMDAIINHGNRFPDFDFLGKSGHNYFWTRDFPVQFQNRKSGLESIFRLKFQLGNDELVEFHNETKTTGNDIIPIEVKFGKDNLAKISVTKQGSPSYNKQSTKVTKFIADRISFNYIQAVRTEQLAKRALSKAIWSRMSELQNNPEYKDALEQIEIIRQKEMDKISSQLVNPLKVFLPQLKSVSIKQKPLLNYQGLLDDIDVFIDDGVKTSISNKGDGIKSLLTLAILNEGKSMTGASIVAIEEPESHLHPGAIHSLVEVINNMSKNNQVIVTTHNPLFVQQNALCGNVIVNKGTARPARSIEEIRTILGVQPSDNLRNARFVLLVEGENDKISLKKILSFLSSDIKFALDNNSLVIKPLSGAANLSHDANDLKISLCRFVVLLDNDEEGKRAYEKAHQEGYVSDSEVRFTICNGCAESEFEDCINPKLYAESIKEKYRVDIGVKEFKTKEKWSIRMKKTFLSQGALWNSRVEMDTKLIVSKTIPEVITSIDKVLIKQKSGFIDGLVSIVEEMIAL